jgi:hypothetical protein
MYLILASINVDEGTSSVALKMQPDTFRELIRLNMNELKKKRREKKTLSSLHMPS